MRVSYMNEISIPVFIFLMCCGVTGLVITLVTLLFQLHDLHTHKSQFALRILSWGIISQQEYRDICDKEEAENKSKISMRIMKKVFGL